MDYQHGLDDEMTQFAIQYGFVVGFSPCMPVLALLAFALDLAMLRGTLYRGLYVQQRDRPLHAAGLGVWDQLLDALTMAAMLSNALLMSQLLTQGGALHHALLLGLAPDANATDAGFNATASGDFAAGGGAAAAAAGGGSLEEGEGEGCAAPDDAVGALGLAMPMALLLFFILLRTTISSLVPTLPPWLSLLHRRRAHFGLQHNFDASKLQAALQCEQRGGRARACLDSLYAAACFWQTVVWRRQGGQPGIPQWQAAGKSEDDERAEAAADAEAFQNGVSDDHGPQSRAERLQQHLFAVFGTIGLLSTELL